MGPVPVATALAGVGIGVVAVAWVGVCVVAGNAWPWASVVHEDGRRTLLETVFYVEHALRELPLDLILSAAIAGAVRGAVPTVGPEASSRGRIATVVLLLAVAVIVAGTVRVAGVTGVLSNLAQMPTRVGAPLVVGSHWRYHLLSRLALMLLAYAVVAFLGSTLAGRRPVRAGWRSLYAASLVAFAGASFAFGVSAEPFSDPVYLGHQARELMTHTLVTVPVAIAVCLGCGPRGGVAVRPPPRGAARRCAWIAGGVAVALGAYLAIGVLVTDAASAGQSAALGVLIFPHVFEHVLTYVVVAAGAAAMYVLGAPGRPTTCGA